MICSSAPLFGQETCRCAPKLSLAVAAAVSTATSSRRTCSCLPCEVETSSASWYLCIGGVGSVTYVEFGKAKESMRVPGMR